MRTGRRFKIFVFYFIVFFCFPVPVALGQIYIKDAILGKWERYDTKYEGKETIEFFKDGTVSTFHESLGFPATGDYRFIDDNHIRINLGGIWGLVGPIVCKVSVSGDNLILTMPDGEVEKYQRVGIRPEQISKNLPTINRIEVSPQRVEVGKTITLRVNFSNTSSTAHTFIVGASLWQPDDLIPDVDFEKQVTLAPYQSAEVSWSYQVDRPGDWGYQFAIWRQRPYTPENLLARHPSPIEFFTVSSKKEASADALREKINKFRNLWHDGFLKQRPPSETPQDASLLDKLGYTVVRLKTPKQIEDSNQLYFLSQDWAVIALRTLRMAESLLSDGEVELANEYLEKALRYQRLNLQTYITSFDIYFAAIDIAERLVIAEAAMLAMSSAIAALTGGLGLTPIESYGVKLFYNGFHTAFNYAIDKEIHQLPLDKANKKAVVKFLVSSVLDNPKVARELTRPITRFVGKESGFYQFLKAKEIPASVRPEIMRGLAKLSAQGLLKATERDIEWIADKILNSYENIIYNGEIKPSIAEPQITSSLGILEPPPYKVGQTITAEFSIKNAGTFPITFDVLTVGGRLNGGCPNDKCPDFDWKTDITLQPGESYHYKGNLKLEAPGNYHFFTAYRTKEGWNTAIPTEAGINNTIDIQVIQVQAQPDDTYRDLKKWLFGDAPNVQLTAKWNEKNCDIWGDKWGTGKPILKDCRHTGIDFGAPEGTPVSSATDGVVVRVEHGRDCQESECLSTVAIYNKATDVTFLYLHMKDIRIKLNDEIKADTEIGKVGQRGPATNAHLHFEARSGKNARAADDVRHTIDPYKAAKKAREFTFDPSFLLGKWVPEYEKKVYGKHVVTLEFKKDGTLVSTMTTAGKWEVKKSDQIVLSTDPQLFPGYPVVETCQMEGDALKDSFGQTLTKDKDAHLIRQTTKGRIWDRYVISGACSTRDVRLQNNGTFLSTIFISNRWKLDGKLIKVFTPEGKESPWIYELKDEKIEVKLKDAPPDVAFVPFVKASEFI